MLIDNKTVNDQHIRTVFEFIERYTEGGGLDIVSGYFSISGLALLREKLTSVEEFRLILGEITEDKKMGGKVVNLLSENISVQSALSLNHNAQKAVDFLNEARVTVRTVEPNFCHAKTYIYKDKKDFRNSYYILGSSNLTYAGLGLKASSNVELNIARHSEEDEYKNLVLWFKNLWEQAAKSYTIVEGKHVPFNEYLITVISDFFKKYSPEELYYKTLFELFKDNLPELFAESGFNEQIGHLKNTKVFNALYPFQKQGVLSLIRMIQNYGGAILADAVGLGKTWQALAVIKHFQLQGYEIILLCPKKLEHNWRQYLKGHQSKFETDRLDYTIRYHTDLQDERLERKEDRLKIKTYFQNNPKVLFVIDESHNLRNDKSSRYKFLVETLLQQNTDVRMLLLSATPINNHIVDIRNQFKLIVKGSDDGFSRMPDFAINSLKSLFSSAQKEFSKWQNQPDPKTIEGLISQLPAKIFDLSDKLVLARTRKIIESQTNDLVFPNKEMPQNEYVEIGKLGKLTSFASILDALKINMTAYRPTEFSDASKDVSVLEDNMQREKFLAKMMYILLVKRLESSWYSFELTINNLLSHHQNALKKVEAYQKAKVDATFEGTEGYTAEDDDEMEEVAKLVESQILGEDNPSNDDSNPLEATLGKKRPIKLSEIVRMDEFREYLEKDITQLKNLKNQVDDFKKKFDRESGNTQSLDLKLQRLMQILNEKTQQTNKKVVIFTAFKDTAKYLYNQFLLRGYKNIGLITGGFCKTDVPIKYRESDFEPLLEAFAPYTKLWREKEWAHEFKNEIEPTNFEEFKTRISEKNKNVKLLLDNPIDILIATDCISEGQNLQDCDCVINYDIHWNPVRLIQRFGRIDRLGSPNKVIKGINFWPGKNYDAYLKLKSRVEDRMALFSLVGAEYDSRMTPELEAKVRENPLITRQTENLLKQLQTDWADIESNPETLGFDKLSLEEFRQELFEWFNRRRQELEAIPNGVFTGFKVRPELFQQAVPTGLIALLRYRGETLDGKPEHHLLYVHNDGRTSLHNLHEILSILRKHKRENRYVPTEIDDSDPTALDNLAKMIQSWMDDKAGRQAVQDIQMMFEFGIQGTPSVKNEESLLLEDKFQNDNFDLITWFVLS